MKTFGQLKSEIRAELWPSGEPENLVSAHNANFQEAAAEIAKWIDCEQDHNVNLVHFCKTFTKCGMTVVPKPPGIVQRVYTIANQNFCDPVEYRMVSWPKPEWWARTLLGYLGTLISGKTNLGLGFSEADAANDSPCGRGRTGIFSVHEKNIYMAPWIQSMEWVVIHWRGIKTEYRDEDPVNESQDYKKCLKLYVNYLHERDYGDLQRAVALYNTDAIPHRGVVAEALASLGWRCLEETKTRETPMQPDQRTLLTLDVVESGLPPAPTPPPQFAHVSDFGGGGSHADAVAAVLGKFSEIAIISSGNLCPSQPVSPPSAPINLSATAATSEVDLSWTAASGATSYTLYRSLTHSGPYSVVATGIPGTTYQDTGLTNGTTYYYVVTAVGPGGESTKSNEANATPQVVPIDPPTIGDVAIWLKADAGVYTDSGSTPATNGQTVQQWNDQSGNGEDVSQTNASHKPTYSTNQLNGLPVVHFDNATDANYPFMSRTGYNLPQPMTIVTVVKFLQTNAGQILGSSQQGSNNVSMPGIGRNFPNPSGPVFDGKLRIYNGGSPSICDVVSTNSWVIVTAVLNGSSSSISVNGGTPVAGDAGSASMVGIVIGNKGSLAGFHDHGIDVAEIAKFSRVLSSSEIKSVEQYLKNKYAL